MKRTCWKIHEDCNPKKLVALLEGGWPREDNAETFDDPLYTDIRDLVFDMKGSPVQDVVAEISNKLDVRIENLDPKLQNVFLKLYDQVNGTNKAT